MQPMFSLSCLQIFLDYTKEGSRFVFGDLIDSIFAFQVSGNIELYIGTKPIFNLLKSNML